MNKLVLGLAACCFSSWSAAALTPALSAPASPFDRCAEAGPAVQAQGFFANNLASLDDVRASQGGQYPSRDQALAVAQAQLEVTAPAKGVCVGYLYRAQWQAQANRDAVDLLAATRRGEELEVGRNYQPVYRERGFTAHGLRLSHALELPMNANWKARLGGAFSVLRGGLLKQDDIQGNVTAQSADQLAGQASRVLAYSEINPARLSPFLPAGSPSGQGFSADLAARFEAKSGLRMEWVLGDAWSRMRWRDMPVSQQQYDTTATLDGAGRLSALYAGKDTRQGVNLSFGKKIFLGLEVPTAYGRASVSNLRWAGTNFPQLGFTRELWPGWHGGIDYDTFFGSVGLGLKRGGFHAGVRSDSLKASSAKVFGFDLGYGQAF